MPQSLTPCVFSSRSRQLSQAAGALGVVAADGSGLSLGTRGNGSAAAAPAVAGIMSAARALTGQEGVVVVVEAESKYVLFVFVFVFVG